MENTEKPLLNEQEETALKSGQELYEMVQTSAGWKQVNKWLDDMAFHSWVDPREINSPGGMSKAEWEWRELNAFHASNVAREILENIAKSISESEYLSKVKNGEIKKGSLKI